MWRHHWNTGDIFQQSKTLLVRSLTVFFFNSVQHTNFDLNVTIRFLTVYRQTNDTGQALGCSLAGPGDSPTVPAFEARPLPWGSALPLVG